jgi:hypothetical protein
MVGRHAPMDRQFLVTLAFANGSDTL